MLVRSLFGKAGVCAVGAAILATASASLASADPAPTGQLTPLVFTVPDQVGASTDSAVIDSWITFPSVDVAGLNPGDSIPGFSPRVDCSDGFTKYLKLVYAPIGGTSSFNAKIIDPTTSDQRPNLVGENGQQCWISGAAPSGYTLTLTPQATNQFPDGWVYTGTDVYHQDLQLQGTVTVDPSAQTPTATAMNYSIDTNNGTTLTVDAADGIIANTAFPAASSAGNGSDGWDAMLQNGSTGHGNLAFNRDGSFTYIPDAGFKGDDTFQYLLHNNSFTLGAWTNVATVTIHVS